MRFPRQLRDAKAGNTAIGHWHANAEHQFAQRADSAKWYRAFELRVAKVERASGFRTASPAQPKETTRSAR